MFGGRNSDLLALEGFHPVEQEPGEFIAEVAELQVASSEKAAPQGDVVLAGAVDAVLAGVAAGQVGMGVDQGDGQGQLRDLAGQWIVLAGEMRWRE